MIAPQNHNYMASVKKIVGKTGVAYKITVTHGTDHTGKQVRHYKTWKPDPKMTDRQIEKALQKAAMDFEREIEQGYQVDRRQTFAQYASYVLQEMEREEKKHKTIYEYRQLTKRIYPEIGHLKLQEIRPQHLNAFYAKLAKELKRNADRSVAKEYLNQVVEQRALTRKKISELSGVSTSTISAACRGIEILRSKAEQISRGLDVAYPELFETISNQETLSNSTQLAYHRFIQAVLARAEKEMLIPYNPADKATPAKKPRSKPKYFQPEEITRIISALETEPLKWKIFVLLLIFTGCRKSEILGLKWSKVNFQNSSIQIDLASLYTRDVGTYTNATKTENERTLILPAEIMTVLHDYRKSYLELQLANGDRWVGGDYVFVQDNGKPMHPDSPEHWLSDFSKRHGLPHINAHALRHSAASLLIGNNVDIVTVSKQLGHKDVTTTENIYAHLLEKNRAKAPETIADIVLRKPKKQA